MRIGLISDTHNHFDPRLPALFQGVDHILHAGDICDTQVIHELEQIAPVTAVLGNNDFHSHLRETEVVELAAKKFLIQHIVNVRAPAEAFRRRLAFVAPDVVVFGHTHRPFAEQVGSILFFNPGYAGRPRFNQPRSVATMEWNDGELNYRFIELPLDRRS